MATALLRAPFRVRERLATTAKILRNTIDRNDLRAHDYYSFRGCRYAWTFAFASVVECE
jgi:hypothetical protein